MFGRNVGSAPNGLRADSSRSVNEEEALEGQEPERTADLDALESNGIVDESRPADAGAASLIAGDRNSDGLAGDHNADGHAGDDNGEGHGGGGPLRAVTSVAERLRPRWPSGWYVGSANRRLRSEQARYLREWQRQNPEDRWMPASESVAAPAKNSFPEWPKRPERGPDPASMSSAASAVWDVRPRAPEEAEASEVAEATQAIDWATPPAATDVIAPVVADVASTLEGPPFPLEAPPFPEDAPAPEAAPLSETPRLPEVVSPFLPPEEVPPSQQVPPPRAPGPARTPTGHGTSGTRSHRSVRGRRRRPVGRVARTHAGPPATTRRPVGGANHARRQSAALVPTRVALLEPPPSRSILEAGAPQPAEPRKRSRRPRPARLAALVAVLVLLAASLAMVVGAYRSSYQVFRQVQGVAATLKVIQNDLQNGRVVPPSALDDLTANASAAQRTVDQAGAGFSFAASLPFVGRPADAARLAAAAAGEEADAGGIIGRVAENVLGTPVHAASTADVTVYQGGRVDLGVIRQLDPNITALLQHLKAGRALLASIPIIPFSGALADMKAQALADSDSAIRFAERALSASRLLPSLLGSDGPTNYLVTLVGGANPTASGQLLAFANLAVDRGTLGLEATGGRDSSTPLAGELKAIGDTPPGAGGFPAMAKQWAKTADRFGPGPVGVIALDPFAVAMMLQSEKPIRVAGYPGDITTRNVVPILERDLALLPTHESMALSDEILRAAFQDILHPGSFLSMAKGVATAASSGHVAMWSSDPALQRLMVRLGWTGRPA
jgi:hypothetical protein